MGGQLGRHAFEGGEGSHGHNLAVGRGELVAGEDVAKEVRLQIVVVLRAEGIVEGAAGEEGLHLGAYFERTFCIVPHCGAGPGLALDPSVGTALYHLAQHTQSVE